MQSGMSTFASRSKTGFKSYIPKLMMTLEVRHISEVLYPGTPKKMLLLYGGGNSNSLDWSEKNFKKCHLLLISPSWRIRPIWI